MSAPRNPVEEKVVELVRDGRDGLVELVAELVAFDTTARAVGDPPRDEARLQETLAARLRAIGAEVDIWEPEPTGTGNRFVPDDLDFAGRPQLAARLAGTGGGRSLLLNGHIDAVTPGPREDWASDPFRAVVHDGRLWGRGVNDMKGGLASLAFALETLHRAGVKLRGEVVYCANTDEESSGAGSLACVQHGVHADAGICGEPTDFDAWVCCRGTVMPVITVEGRAGHAEMPQPHWRSGGAVNAIEKAKVVLDAIEALRNEWRGRPDKQHWCLAPGDIVPTVIAGGVWTVTYPPHCAITCDVQYLPGDVDDEGTAKAVEAELRDWIDGRADADPWLREHPLHWRWTEDIVPAEVPAEHPIVTTVLGAGAAVGRPGKVSGLDSWHDAAHFTRWGKTPTLSFGPDGIDSAHAVDENVSVDALVDHCAAIALAAMRWCGV
ncbi:MAG TPA: ArgE/DapE family deacylase [Thermoleophilia bacterium]|nr:ArgE/DapE family deacylase [Thermoleophilia bacterium]